MKDDLIQKAQMIAIAAHINQLDDDGEPHYLHVLKVANIVKMVTDDTEVIAAALLHDTIEDAEITYEYLAEHFTKRIADLVQEVTHVHTVTEGNTFPNLHSREGAMIKFADRLHNLSRMGCWDEARQTHYLKKSSFWKGGEIVHENK